MLPRLIAALLVAGALTSCSGQSCDGLTAMQAERDALREAYGRLTAGSAAPDEVDRAHDALHAYEARVFDVEQECADR